MARNVLVSIFLLSCIAAASQSVTSVENHATKAFRFQQLNPVWLSMTLTKPFNNQEDKVRAIYLWITEHIRYDAKRFAKFKDKNQSVKQTLRKRKGLCSDYSNLFLELCKHAGIKAYPIEGYAKGFGHEDDDLAFGVNHVWNMVEVNGKWQLVDLTFASGYLAFVPYFHERLRPLLTLFTQPFVTRSKLVFVKQRNDFYYLTNPSLFIKDHLPATPMFQLLHHPINTDSFERCNKSECAMLLDSSKAIDYAYDINLWLLETKHSSYITLGDSANSFNCRNKLYQAYCYQRAGMALLKDNPSDIGSANEGINYLRLSNAIIVEGKPLVNEEAYYKLVKNRKRYRFMKNNTTALIHSVNKVGNYCSGKIRQYKAKKRTLSLTKARVASMLDNYYKLNYNDFKRDNQKDTQNIEEKVNINKAQMEVNARYINQYLAEIDMVLKALAKVDFEGTLYIEMIKKSQRIKQCSNHILDLRIEHLDNLDMLNHIAERELAKRGLDSIFRESYLNASSMVMNKRDLLRLVKKLSRTINGSMHMAIENLNYGSGDEVTFNAARDSIIVKLEDLQRSNLLFQYYLDKERLYAESMVLINAASLNILNADYFYEKHRFNVRNEFVTNYRNFKRREATRMSKQNTELVRKAKRFLASFNMK